MEWNPAWQEAIAAIESRGSGNYSAVTDSGGGNRAYGRYQIMDFNIPSWTERWLGQSMTPEEFLNDPAAQDAVFQGQFGSYVDRWGNPRDAASAWFTGQPLSRSAGRRDVLGTTTSEYMRRFDRELGLLDGAEVGPMRTDELIANAGGAIDRAEAPSPLSRLASFFGVRSEPSPSGGGAMPSGSIFSNENLSREQRRLLGFAALADAGAAFSGRQGGQTQALMSQMQAEQERERLRRQGLLQNLVAFEQALLPYRISGMTPPPGIQSAYDNALAEFSSAGGGMPTAAPAGVAPTPAGGVAAPAPVAETPLATPAGEPATVDPIVDLERRRDMARAAGMKDMADSYQAQIDDIKAAESRAQQAQIVASRLKGAGDIISDYLISGFDIETGEPIINPALTSRAGQFVADAYGSNEYVAFEKAIQTIKNNVSFETLGEMKASGLTVGSLSDPERESLAETIGSLDPRDPIGSLATLRRIEQEYGINFGLSAPSAGSSVQVGGLTFTEEN